MAKIIMSDIKTGFLCNNRCLHCCFPRRRFNHSTRDCLRRIRNAVKRGTNIIVLTGGEPTIRKDFTRLLDYAKEHDLAIALQTNGRKFADREFAEIISEYPIYVFIIAIHGHVSRIHDKITQAKGSFEQTVEGIKNLVSMDRKVAAKVVISKINYRYLIDIAKLVRKLGVFDIQYAFPHALGSAARNFSRVVPRYRTIMPYVKSTLSYCKRYGLECELETFPPCLLAGRRYRSLESSYRDVLVDIDGNFLKCDDWNKKRASIKCKFDSCRRCIHFKKCEGVWSEYAEKFGGSEFTPIERR